MIWVPSHVCKNIGKLGVSVWHYHTNMYVTKKILVDLNMKL